MRKRHNAFPAKFFSITLWCEYTYFGRACHHSFLPLNKKGKHLPSCVEREALCTQDVPGMHCLLPACALPSQDCHVMVGNTAYARKACGGLPFVFPLRQPGLPRNGWQREPKHVICKQTFVGEPRFQPGFFCPGGNLVTTPLGVLAFATRCVQGPKLFLALAVFPHKRKAPAALLPANCSWPGHACRLPG